MAPLPVRTSHPAARRSRRRRRSDIAPGECAPFPMLHRNVLSTNLSKPPARLLLQPVPLQGLLPAGRSRPARPGSAARSCPRAAGGRHVRHAPPSASPGANPGARSARRRSANQEAAPRPGCPRTSLRLALGQFELDPPITSARVGTVVLDQRMELAERVRRQDFRRYALGDEIFDQASARCPRGPSLT